ncbi:glycoside hydrolase family 3 protein [Novosphingobium flavum]|uniref:beta-N-acetylhexosaminidase n=1 Tax=Novosphingobium flavum TaxID=1778672 RepID=A0A7X1KLA9_9SPHN|nr:glycoside hydrolase family 3 protein [Novosphingobium flavum]MBC2665411.1 glycoside hydrolase family 3 protein [Novosphingobium flavum]
MSTRSLPTTDTGLDARSPLALDAEALAWVERTRDGLCVEDLVAQLFNFATETDSEDETSAILALKPGAIHRFPTRDLAAAVQTTRAILERSEVPPLISGDIEGGTISYAFATAVPNQMGFAACNDLATSVQLARIVAQESRALGYDWSFTPVVDVNAEFRSAIVGTRSYGSDPDTVLAQARAYVGTLQSEGMAACAKHWPGDGFDERDQHLVTTVNPLDMDAWRSIFGRIYQTLIDDGVMTIMSAHIALPAYVRSKLPDAGREAFRPATVSRLLNEDLLRGELGFKGLIVSDATGMGGLTSWTEREEVVPEVIENGCDMFLFSRNPARDVGLMMKGLREGRLSERRLYEAATRVLSLKAALGLHVRSIDERLPDLETVRTKLRTPQSLATARDALGKGVTLVKDTANLLPIDPQRHRRVVVIAEEGWSFFSGALERSLAPAISALGARGFEVRMYDRDNQPTREDTDLVLYLVGQEATPTASRIFLDLAKLHDGTRKAMTQSFREIPTALVSFGQPYYLFDAPTCTTAINAYNSLAECQEEVVRRLVGDVPFTGKSPVDAFCGREQLKW